MMIVRSVKNATATATTTATTNTTTVLVTSSTFCTSFEELFQTYLLSDRSSKSKTRICPAGLQPIQNVNMIQKMLQVCCFFKQGK